MLKTGAGVLISQVRAQKDSRQHKIHHRRKKMKRINALALTLGLAALVCIPMYTHETTTYNFETIKYSGDTFTELLGINNSDKKGIRQ
jgi:hypothetical protein